MSMGKVSNSWPLGPDRNKVTKSRIIHYKVAVQTHRCLYFLSRWLLRSSSPSSSSPFVLGGWQPSLLLVFRAIDKVSPILLPPSSGQIRLSSSMALHFTVASKYPRKSCVYIGSVSYWTVCYGRKKKIVEDPIRGLELGISISYKLCALQRLLACIYVVVHCPHEIN